MVLVYTWENKWHRLWPIIYSGMSFRLQDSPSSGSSTRSSQGNYLFLLLGFASVEQAVEFAHPVACLLMYQEQPSARSCPSSLLVRLWKRTLKELEASTQNTRFFLFQQFQNGSLNWTFTKIPG